MSIAILDDQNNIIRTDYVFHKGEIHKNLIRMLDGIDPAALKSISYTSSTPDIVNSENEVDSRVAYISAARHFHPGIRSLLIIGAEKFGLATFNEKGDYSNYKSNTSCAAGTGNFLDQQAERLNLTDIKEFSRIAHKNKGSFPKIASRCAVFAKTDLIHAQQEGYSLAEICDGLSYGLAKNIVDTVFQNQPGKNFVAAGGVALNKAVIDHIERLAKISVKVDEYANVYGAIGAAMNQSESKIILQEGIRSLEDILQTDKKKKQYYFPPLQVLKSEYPDFEKDYSYEFRSEFFPNMKIVEVDAYTYDEGGGSGPYYLGIDIGSTSTKAVLLDNHKEVTAGFYTRTAGQPLQAIQTLMEAITDYAKRRKIGIEIAAAGTTGSGRKFTGKIIGADLILDEISAHARAAYELDPETDTIIEIGGQDSKFTILRNGMVTFSVMNNICAAGTGSFVEEQARRLNCSLDEYSSKVENVSSPMASDRCTVFMERDLNHLLMAGYSTNEILAAVLHSTCENYLTKVASKGHIGKKIFFQGATAKNKGLLAAFEQKLGQAIMVSRYCHLTGALGVALELHDLQANHTNFKGLDIYKKTIPVRSEVCELCTNHCKLKIAEIDGDSVAYGFLCGRDYDVKKYVKHKNKGFQLLKQREKVFRFKARAKETDIIIGIPAGLHLYEEVPFWRSFFDSLSIKTVTSEDYNTPVKDGKHMSGAEFCAPIAAMYGHADYLKDKCDYIFLPVYLAELQESKMKKQFCYYTQYISSVISVREEFAHGKKLLTPTLKHSHEGLHVRLELFKMLRSLGLKDIQITHITHAYNAASREQKNAREKWKELYLKESAKSNDVHVMLLGRPYTVLSKAMNSHIPEIFEKMGIKTFFMDMLPDKLKEISKANELIKAIHWKFASKILYAAELVAQTDNCYPVLVTSFKCTPDSFVIEYFKNILDAYNKPYLILQLDEHDSSVGYETRIEAAIRAFRNHRIRKQPDIPGIDSSLEQLSEKSDQQKRGYVALYGYMKGLVQDASSVLKTHAIDFKLFSKRLQKEVVEESQLSHPIVTGEKHLKGKTMLIPMWDPYVSPLLEAVLKHSGVDARLVPYSDESTQRSMSLNTGQCLPLNIIVQSYIDYIEENKLDPSKTVLWIIKGKLSCNLTMFPHYMKKLLADYGKGMEQTTVYVGDVVFYDVSLSTAINSYLAYMFGGYVRKIACSIRPYETKKGTTERIIKKSLKTLYSAFLKGKPNEDVIKKIIADFDAIETKYTARPKVAIFGDLYVRDNDQMNQELIKTIEDNGGEVITTPFSEYIKITAYPLIEKNFKEGRYLNYAKIRFLKSLVPLVEDKYKKYFSKYAGKNKLASSKEIDEWLTMYGLNVMQGGESLENVLKIHTLVREYPDLDLFIQTNPSYCCPSLITEAMTERIEDLTDVPIVTIEYDGTSGVKNEDLIPYLKYRKKKTLV